MNETPRITEASYERPRLRLLGSVHVLTQSTNKTDGGSDGLTYNQQPIHFTS